jgi:formate dehydrogenase
MVRVCDVITINAPLHPETEHLFNDALIGKMKRGVPQPAPKDHPWRTMPHHGMTPHTSGTSLSAQARYAAGAREILECWLEGRPIRQEYLIVDGGKLAGAGAHSYSVGKSV